MQTKTNQDNVTLEKLIQVFGRSWLSERSKNFGIDRMTLKRFIKRQWQTSADETVLTGFSNHAEMKQILNIVYETELAVQKTKLSCFGVN